MPERKLTGRPFGSRDGGPSPLARRDAEIRAAWHSGQSSIPALARRYRLSNTRVWQIIHRGCEPAPQPQPEEEHEA